MILVTGAAGKTGRAVVRALVEQGTAVRALVRRPQQRELLLKIGAFQVVIGDLADRSTIKQAVDGIEAIYHICPNVDPLEITYANLLMREARAARVRRFGYHSVLHPQTKRMEHHWKKLRVEELIFESGLDFTILQPCAYMQNLFAQMDGIVERGVIEVPYSIEAQLSLVDLRDVAAAVVNVLCEPGHEGAVYELAGPTTVDHRQIAAVVGKVLGRSIRVDRVSVDAWAENARRAGMGDYQVSTLCSMFDYYDQFGLNGNPNVLEYLLGRRPSTLDDVVRRTLAVA